MEERKPIIKNVFGRKKKIAVININGNDTGKAVVQALKDKGFQRVYEFDSLRSYPAYYALQEFEPEYTMIVDETSSQCKIKNCIVDDETKLHTRKRENSQFAKDFYQHHLMMLGIKPKFSGKYEVPYEDVKRMDWFLKDDSPFLCLELPRREGVPEAVATAVKEYFNSKAKVAPKEEKPDCPNCLYGVVSR